MDVLTLLIAPGSREMIDAVRQLFRRVGYLVNFSLPLFSLMPISSSSFSSLHDRSVTLQRWFFFCLNLSGAGHRSILTRPLHRNCLRVALFFSKYEDSLFPQDLFLSGQLLSSFRPTCWHKKGPNALFSKLRPPSDSISPHTSSFDIPL